MELHLAQRRIRLPWSTHHLEHGHCQRDGKIPGNCKAQDLDVPGGAYDDLVNSKTLGSYALVANPAGWGNSGVIIFTATHDGAVYQEDLGSNTPAVARAMTPINPDNTWRLLETAWPGAMWANSLP